MATSVTQSLFGMTPEALQAQRDAALNEQALQFSKLSPMQQAQMGLFRGASQLGTGLAGLMGYQDPEMQRIKTRQGLLGGVDMSDPAALRQAAQQAQQSGDFAAAQELINRANEVALSQAQVGRETALTTKAEAEARAKQAEAAADSLGLQGRAQFLMSRVEGLTPEMAMGLATDKTIASKLLEQPRRDTIVVETANGQELRDKVTGELIATFGGKPTKPSMGAEIAAGLSPLVGAIAEERAKRTGSAEGAEVGKQTAMIQGKYDAITALDNSLKILGNSKDGYNIYAGTIGPEMTFIAKATGGLAGDRNKAINSEQFLAEVSTTVIPMLQEFGGNDSNEELKFLQRIVGGDQRLEPESIERIIKSAKAKIERGIKRVQAQQQATEQGTPLPTGPMGSTPKPTMRWNPQTRTLEKVQ